MYDSPSVQDANDRLWGAIARRLRGCGLADVPDTLDRSRPLEVIWEDPALLLAQTCGYPLVTRFEGRLKYVATPRYGAVGCEGFTHRSRVVIRKRDPAGRLEDFRGRLLAINDRESNTGMNLLRALIAPIAGGDHFFGRVVETGSHAASARAVAEGEADIAAIDNVTYAHIEREEPDVATELRTLAWTAASPALPFVTPFRTPDRLVSQLRKAIGDAIEDEPGASGQLMLDGIETIGARGYHVVKSLEATARRRGYPVLR
jgi:ABC-type phosphate/phosphonate transport system substrate-binding protein